jgi:hypothetical protein
MNIYYRISNNSYKKNRLPHATKEYCLTNFLKEFHCPENFITIVADNVTDVNLLDFIEKLKCDNITVVTTSLGNTKSFKLCINLACLQSTNSDLIYFAEDDYLYLPESFKFLKEGLAISDYVTLYDHPDKYLDAVYGGNPQIENGGEITRVVLTKSIHWKITNSTTGTFGVRAKSLKEDKTIWEKYFTGSYGNDYLAFCELIGISKRSLISCIPGKATHVEIPWLSPLHDWENHS